MAVGLVVFCAECVCSKRLSQERSDRLIAVQGRREQNLRIDSPFRIAGTPASIGGILPPILAGCESLPATVLPVCRLAARSRQYRKPTLAMERLFGFLSPQHLPAIRTHHSMLSLDFAIRTFVGRIFPGRPSRKAVHLAFNDFTA